MVVWAGLVLVDFCSAEAKNSAAAFAEPPVSARPWAYWDFLNGNIHLPTITRELEQAREKGMGGFDLWDVAPIYDERLVPAGPAFMGPESVDGLCYALREAKRLGLGIGLVTSSSWNAGGAWIKPENASMALYESHLLAQGPKHLSQIIPFPELPDRRRTAKRPSRKQKPPLIERRPDGLPVFYKDVAVLAWPYSEDKLLPGPSSIIDLSAQMDKDGTLNWDVPAGKWQIVRYVCANTGERLKRPSPNSDGLILDHFSAEATEAHLDFMLGKLLGNLGSFRDTALKYVYFDSYEVRGLLWTPKFLEEFERRRGYEMKAFLPVLFGWTIQNKQITDRFIFDFNKTRSDLIIDNHYVKAGQIARRYGLQIGAESGGPGSPLHNCPVEALRALGVQDVPRGEFWNKHQFLDEDGVDILWLVKEIACAAHIYGRKIVEAEAFTSLMQWQEGPAELKPLADRALCEGLNRFVFHTFPHEPPEAGLPGWAYFGTHINPTRVWWPKAKPFIYYLARCSYLLQQGLFVGDVCYYYGDKAPNFVKPKHIDPSLGYGYDYDVTNSDVILNRMDVRDSKIVLPDGTSYELLVLPDQNDINLDVLKKLEQLVRAGATVVGPKPVRSNGLKNYLERDEKICRLADKLWGQCDGKNVTEHSYGKGKIVWGRKLRNILVGRNVRPDFTFSGARDASLDFIHRRTQDADIYFVSNRKMRPEQVDCTFRVKGKTPELWLPDTGQMRRCAVYDSVEGGTRLPLRLEPMGSVFVVFREPDDGANIVSLSRNGKRVFPGYSSAETAGVELSHNNRGDTELVADRAGKYVVETAAGRKISVDIDSVPAGFQIKGPWDVHFPAGWGAPPSKVFSELISWSKTEEDGIKYFSGIATYNKKFEIPGELTASDVKLVLDLGRVREVADVYLNGRHLGILWKQPYRIDITGAARAGSNDLVVEVANTWNNRLVGDGKLPKERRFTHTNIVNGPTAWMKPWKDVDLLDSGLIGPVRVLTAKKLCVGVSQ